MRTVELFVPDLPAFQSNAGQSPAMHRWLSRARLERQPCESLEAALCARFGVTRQSDWPVAPLTLRADGVDPGNRWWLRADPAHLHPARGELVLARSAELDLTQAEADAIVATLNEHFAPEALGVLAPCPQRWYLGLESPQALVTTPPCEAVGRSVDPLLPRGAAALSWHRRLNEMQMLLHEHPVNVQREARGAPTVNSLWLWGGGVAPACPPAPALAIWSDDTLVRGLALCANLACANLPAGAAAWLQRAPPAEHLVVLGERATGQDALRELDEVWLAPLLGAVRDGSLNRATLVTQLARHVLSFAISRVDLWKFWRRPPVLEAAPHA